MEGKSFWKGKFLAKIAYRNQNDIKKGLRLDRAKSLLAVSTIYESLVS